MKINGASYKGQNYRALIKDEPDVNSFLKLFLINLGAYIPTQFGEVHKYLIVVGEDKTDAKTQGKLAIETNWLKPHTDAIIDIDDCLELHKINQKYVHLVKGDFTENTYKNDYLIIK